MVRIIGHASFLGDTGYNSHSQNFFLQLSKFFPLQVRNYSYVENIEHVPKEILNLVLEQDWKSPPYKIGKPLKRDPSDIIVNIVLNETNHYYFFDPYESPSIAYNVWETTRQPRNFFKRILEFDQFWCPSEWQKICTMEQGYPEERIRVIPEGVDGSIFYPDNNEKEKIKLFSKYEIDPNCFLFMVFGRWEHRKCTREIIQSFLEVFGSDKNIMLLLSVDNPFSRDGLGTTENRLRKYNLESENIKVVHFLPRGDYVKFLKYGNVLLSCSRSEGWNLPLIEALACGTPATYSNWGAQKEFADGIGIPIEIKGLVRVEGFFDSDNKDDLGFWSDPDFEHFKIVIKDVFENYDKYKDRVISRSEQIRENFSWVQAAEKAVPPILELTKKFFKFVDHKVKLNLGCGNDIKPGYINIDLYSNQKKVDLIADVRKLPFLENSVEELFSSHLLEHFPVRTVFSLLEEWHRVLKIGGKLELYVPNLEKKVISWLNSGKKDNFIETRTIFGEQDYEGNIHYCGFTIGSLRTLLEDFGFHILELNEVDRGFGEEIHCIASKVQKKIYRPTIICHFVDGPFGEVKSHEDDPSIYEISFYDKDSSSHVHTTLLKRNHWTRPHRKFYTNWKVTFKKNNKTIFVHHFYLKNKKVLISMDSKSLGDTIAWFPYVEEFRKKHDCMVWVSTFWNQLFQNSKKYQRLNFVEPGEVVDDLYASYSIGCYDNDSFKNPTNWRLVPLQKIASDILGLEFKEIKPEIGVDISNFERPVEGKYVSISEWSTLQAKLWNYEGGWQKIVDFLRDLGYQVVVVSKEETKLENVIDCTGRHIFETIANISNSELFIGVGTGLSWLAWVLNVPVVLISGFSKPWTEFQTGVERVINEDVCNGCFNDPSLEFVRGDWNWCPRKKGTGEEFICTKSISPDMVQESILKILGFDKQEQIIRS